MDCIDFTCKTKLRRFWKKSRGTLSPIRHQIAAFKLLSSFREFSGVLSYASFGNELNTFFLNQELAQRKQLFLPKIDGEHLIFYRVEDMHRQLQCNQWGIKEPIPELCKGCLPSEIKIILVPGLAFDSKGHRLGSGKGYYDRFLSILSSNIKIYGVAFCEQLSSTLLPTYRTDISMTKLALF
jgi:5-formyltetrahydrofolate cyclo-ligase